MVELAMSDPAFLAVDLGSECDAWDHRARALSFDLFFRVIYKLTKRMKFSFITYSTNYTSQMSEKYMEFKVHQSDN